MPWDVIGPTVLSLAGVIVGSLGTLMSQYLVMRKDRLRDMATLQRERRAERKDAIVAFLAATQHVEMLVGSIDDGEHVDRGKLYERVHEMWLARKVVEIVCSEAFARASDTYCTELQHRVRREKQGTPAKGEARRAALAAARRDIGSLV